MKNSAINSALLLSIFLIQALKPVYAYEVETHGFLTYQAYQASALVTDSNLLLVLSIENIYDQLGSDYYDMILEPNTPDVKQRNINDYEKKKIEKSLGLASEVGAISGWMMQGAIREDDVPSKWYPDCVDADNPQDDPYPGVPYRPARHFYDPVANKGLDILLGEFEKSPNWGTGTDDAFAIDPAANASRRNHFTILDAREAMYRALTGRKIGDPMDASFPNIPNSEKIGPGGVDATNDIRKAYWATTFRALGDVVHLVEDMGQPQHTRNDSHSGRCIVLGDKSVFEKYINARIIQQPVARTEAIDADTTATVTTFPGITITQYPVPKFNRYSDYWSTREGLNGRGLGDFSNREFFSAGTNLNDNQYSSPSNNRGDYQIIPTWSSDKAGIINYLADTVNDAQQPGQQPTGLKTRESILDESISAYFQRDYSLDKTVYDIQAAFLLPRAVAYSAGLLDYFFRGRLAISLPPEGIYGIIDHTVPHTVVNNVPEKSDPVGTVFGFEKIILNVSNVTPDIDDGHTQTPFAQDIGAGTFRAVAHYRLNPCYTPSLFKEAWDDNTSSLPCDTSTINAQSNSELIATSEAVAVSNFVNGAPNRIEFDFSAEPIPVNAADLRIQVVYYGDLGAETQAIAVGMQDISEPSFYLIRNSSDYYSLSQTIYRTDDPAFITAANEAGIPASAYASYTTSAGTLTVGNAAGVVQTPTFNPGEFIRIAYLADYDPVNLISYISPVSGASFVINPRRVSIDQNNALTFQLINSVGDSTNRLYGNSIYNMTHAAYPSGSSYGDFTTMDNFPVPVEKPVTVCFPTTPCP
jgi:hypothetical protein